MSQDPHVYFHLETVEGVTVVHFSELKIGPEASDQLTALVIEGGHRKLLLNFSHLVGLSSISIAKLISLQRKVIALQGQLKVCCVNPNLLELLRYVGLDRYIEIYPTQEDALRAF